MRLGSNFQASYEQTFYCIILLNMNFNQEDANIETKIESLENNEFLSPEQKNARISELRASKLQGTDSSAKTVTSLANTMIGSAIIIYPILFIKDGMIGSTIIMVIIGIIQYITCRLLVVHCRPEEPSFNQPMLRIGGMPLAKFNSFVNALLLFFVCIAYYLLVSTNFYQLSAAIIKFAKPSYNPPKTNDITFDQYSMQWACIISALLCAPALFRRDIQSILKLVKYAIYCVGAYGIFVLASLFRNIIQGKIHFGEYKLFDPDFSNVAGAFALSFLIHPTASPILKKNVNLKNNERDLLLGYILTGFIYFFVGFLGGLACAADAKNITDPKTADEYSTIFDCFHDDNIAEDRAFYYISKVIQLGIFFQNFSVLPILFYLTRKQTLSLINKPHLNKKLFKVITLIFIISATMVGILAIDVSLILSLDGAIVGFFMGYGIPIYLHIKCYHYKYSREENQKRRSLLQSNLDQSLVNMELDDETLEETLACNKHKPKSKTKHLIFYGFIMVIGIMLGIFKISAFFT